MICLAQEQQDTTRLDAINIVGYHVSKKYPLRSRAIWYAAWYSLISYSQCFMWFDELQAQLRLTHEIAISLRRVNHKA